MDTFAKWLVGLIFLVVMTILVLQLAGMTIGDRPILSHMSGQLDPKFWSSVAPAFLVGLLGSWAFYLGVVTGFISRTDRPRLLQFLTHDQELLKPKLRIIFGFIFTGGVVAAVFQAAQLDTFAPIQAFVLGATWPSVVTRIMSGEAVQPPPSTGNAAMTSGDQIGPPATDPTAPPAEVDL